MLAENLFQQPLNRREVSGGCFACWLTNYHSKRMCGGQQI
jgi:hypothetical protein